MHGPGLAQAIALGGGGAGLAACFALVAFCGVLRPLQRSDWVKPPRPARPASAATPTVTLNAIELGLLAELSLEQACAYDELVEDASQQPEIRRAAAASAAAWRERARVFQLHARDRSAAPIVPGEECRRAYTGPERRRAARRRQTRRAGLPASVGVEPADRRSVPDRRQGDRRRPQQIPA